MTEKESSELAVLQRWHIGDLACGPWKGYIEAKSGKPLIIDGKSFSPNP
ncbi:MAG: hypothetical protein GYA24_06070 [Candidatus Lokiarchaeota archaeon]|nr:hypothetical protein [Candidatus Lokiarchaeota archaeon]